MQGEFTVGFPHSFFLSNERNEPPQSLRMNTAVIKTVSVMQLLQQKHWRRLKKKVGGYLPLQKAYRIELAMNVGWYPAYVFVHLNFKSVGISKVQKARHRSQNYL